jgi:hypothetical protein
MDKDDFMRRIRPLALALLAGALWGSPALAQEGPTPADAVGAAALEAAVLGHESASERTRAQLGDLLARDEVRELAVDRGFDAERLAAAVETLSDRELAQVEPLVAEASEALAQNTTITISVYTIIIILLLLILLT